MPLSAGAKLGAYEIVAPLGAGGMGDVYRARDVRVGREVAVKIAAEQFTERSEREARAVAALNHPNICTLYDVGPNYLVMELVEGDAPKGPLPLDTVLALYDPGHEALVDGLQGESKEALEALRGRFVEGRAALWSGLTLGGLLRGAPADAVR